jgi:pantoate--beta-alanine ligase
METITAIVRMKEAVRRERERGRTIGFVPTMGFLHEGHLSLVRAARAQAGTTVVSIFVNPAQFGPREDLSLYPRDLERDSALLEAEGVDYLFHPAVEEMYPDGFRTSVEVSGLEDVLCGRTRPGHFRGVATVVLKLFEIVRPDVAVFGRKDAQQALILERMARDLDLDVRLDVQPIVREPDSLAMSSRNAYLSPEERKAAVVLSRSLAEAEGLVRGGERRAMTVLDRIRAAVAAEPLARLDYAEAVDPEILTPAATLRDGTLLALAVFIGRTRLIDNTVIQIP